jgi:hypothetical protein
MIAAFVGDKPGGSQPDSGPERERCMLRMRRSGLHSVNRRELHFELICEYLAVYPACQNTGGHPKRFDR